jgi:hypothetical protein
MGSAFAPGSRASLRSQHDSDTLGAPEVLPQVLPSQVLCQGILYEGRREALIGPHGIAYTGVVNAFDRSLASGHTFVFAV